MGKHVVHSGAEAIEEMGVRINLLMAKMSADAQGKAWRTLNLLRNSAFDVLGKDGHGRRYRVAHTKGAWHTASAAGEAPAPNLGNLRRSWRQSMTAVKEGKGVKLTMKIVNQMPYAAALEEGTARIKPRPYTQRILDGAKPQIDKLFKK